MSGAGLSSSRKHILLAEDEDDVRTLLTRLLESIADVTAVRNGREALDALRAGPPPDLVITDLMMPELDGQALAREMKADEALARLPVIMLTARTSPRDMVAGINAGARHYLTKPFKTDDLLAKVKKVLGLR